MKLTIRISVFLILILCFQPGCEIKKKQRSENQQITIQLSQSENQTSSVQEKTDLSDKKPLPFPVAYTSERDGNTEVYITLFEGYEGINITQHESSDYNFKPFLDGGVFISQREQDYDIFFVRFDNGIRYENLSESPATEKQMAISFDLQQLLFTSKLENASDIYLYSRDGFPPRNLTPDDATDSFPVWMPDGKSFVFESNRTQNSDIIRQNIETRNDQNLTDNPAKDQFPQVSSDGKMLAFESDREGFDDIYIYAFPTGNLMRITNDTATDNTPLFSPDSKYLAWNRLENDLTEIMLYCFDTGLSYPLTEPQKDYGISGFSPDSRWILFVSRLSGNLDIYYMGIDGSQVTRVTVDDASDYYPIFLPDETFNFVKSVYREKIPDFKFPSALD
jgi:Tol biopolymer transport system component